LCSLETHTTHVQAKSKAGTDTRADTIHLNDQPIPLGDSVAACKSSLSSGPFMSSESSSQLALQLHTLATPQATEDMHLIEHRWHVQFRFCIM